MKAVLGRSNNNTQLFSNHIHNVTVCIAINSNILAAAFGEIIMADLSDQARSHFIQDELDVSIL